MVFLVVIFVFLAAISKAVQDTLSFHFHTSIFKHWDRQFWSPDLSWANKYQDVISLKPRFFGSTTVFSFVTDGWHLAQFFFLFFLFGAIVVHEPFFALKENLKILSILLDFTILRVIFGLTFELFYSKILIKK